MTLDNNNKKILVILGPTSTGKTDLALIVAKKFDGELVSCDSRQVYKGLDIGTGKLPSLEAGSNKLEFFKHNGYWEINGVKTWMYDVENANKQYTVVDYIKDAHNVIQSILSRNKLPIIVGGTGFYLKALFEGLSNAVVPMDFKLRQQLVNLPLNKLQDNLKKLSIEKWNSLNYSDRQNPRRLIRAIEILTLKPCIDRSESKRFNLQQYNILKVGLVINRLDLYKRIDKRVISRINQGMVKEARSLQQKDLGLKRMRELGLEYGVLADFLEGKISGKEELIKVLQGKIHGFARRQMTWFKKEKDINWFDVTEKNYIDKVEKFIAKWYYYPIKYDT